MDHKGIKIEVLDIIPACLNSSYTFPWLCHFPRCPFLWRLFSVSFDNYRQSHSFNSLIHLNNNLTPSYRISPNFSCIFQLLTVIFVRLFHTSNTMHHTQTHHYPIKPVHFDICTSVNSIPISSERLQHSNLSKSLPSLLLYIIIVASLYWLSLKYLLNLFLPFNSCCSHLV